MEQFLKQQLYLPRTDQNLHELAEPQMRHLHHFPVRLLTSYLPLLLLTDRLHMRNITAPPRCRRPYRHEDILYLHHVHAYWPRS